MIKSRPGLIFIFFLSNVHLFAQAPGCPSIFVGNDTSVTCNNSCVTINANVFSAQQTTSYTVSAIPYIPPYPFNLGTQLFIGIDDIWGDTISLPFDFCFYDSSYSQIVVGANGLISFNTAYANLFCPWSYTASVPSTALPLNAVFGAYHDIDPSICGEIKYQILGAFPCRTFVVNFNEVCHFSCNNLETTQQIILYETTNVIEVYIQSKPTCGGWNGGRAVIGIQNATGSAGITPASRNTGNWATSNEAWRFSPDGAPNYTVNWYSGGDTIGTGTSVTVCPTIITDYIAEATYTGCSGQQVIVSDTLTINVLNGFSLSLSSTPSFCQQSDGEATATPGGTGPYTYLWNDPINQITSTAIGLDPGTYTVEVTDTTTGCTFSDSIMVPQDNPLNLTSSIITNTNCFNDSSGVGEVLVSGNTGITSYQWNDPNNQITQQADSLPAGAWQVLVADGAGCIDSVTVTITSPDPVSVSIICPPGCDGQTTTYAVASATGGTGSTYNYQWNDPGATNDDTLIDLQPGTYVVQVIDSLGCATTDSVNANISPSIFSTINIQQATCPTSENGAAIVNPAGGTGLFTYSWNTSPLQSTQSIDSIGAGVYTVIVSDSVGCTDTVIATITNLSNISLIDTVWSHVSCFEGSNGTAYVSSTGNSGAVNYLWNPGGFSGDSINGLSANTYQVIGTDTTGCSDTTYIIINEPTEIEFNVSGNPALCYGASTGSVTVNNTSGGTPGYTYSWNTIPPQITPTATGLNAGVYIITVTDANLCTKIDSAEILDPLPLNIVSQQTNISCNSQNNGTATINASGGAGGFTYNWTTNPVQTDSTAVSLSPGSYYAVITDADGCRDSVLVNISEPNPLITAVSSEQTVCGDSSGTAVARGSEGQAPYSYIWLPSGKTGATVSGLWEGFHYVTVSDANGCNKQDSVIVNQYLGVMADYHLTTDLNDENEVPLDVSFTNQSVISHPGTKPVNYTWSFGDGNFSNEINPIHTYNSEGNFDVWMKVCYAATCCDSVKRTVEVLDTIIVPNVFTPNGDGLNEVFIIKNKNLSQLNLKIYNRWGRAVFSTETVGESWNGNKNNDGPPCPEGTYFYILNATRKDGKQVEEKLRKGAVTLLR